MIIGGLQKSSTIDFPGCLSCVVFVRGCNMDCFFCHNRAIIGRAVPTPGDLSQDEVLAFLEKRKGLLDGVVMSGGEPILYPDLPDFLEKVRAMGYRVKLDTNGSRPGKVTRLLNRGLLDYVAVDYKAHPDDYFSVAAASANPVRATLYMLLQQDVPFEARTTLYTGLTMERLEELLASVPVMPRWRLNYFHQPESSRPEHRARLDLPALTAKAVADNLDRLLAIQPNLIWE